MTPRLPPGAELPSAEHAAENARSRARNVVGNLSASALLVGRHLRSENRLRDGIGIGATYLDPYRTQPIAHVGEFIS